MLAGPKAISLTSRAAASSQQLFGTMTSQERAGVAELAEGRTACRWLFVRQQCLCRNEWFDLPTDGSDFCALTFENDSGLAADLSMSDARPPCRWRGSVNGIGAWLLQQQR